MRLRRDYVAYNENPLRKENTMNIGKVIIGVLKLLIGTYFAILLVLFLMILFINTMIPN